MFHQLPNGSIGTCGIVEDETAFVMTVHPNFTTALKWIEGNYKHTHKVVLNIPPNVRRIP